MMTSSSDVTVHVTILDVNDNAPRIVFNTLSAADATIAHVSENSVSGSFVAHVTASDADVGQWVVRHRARPARDG